MGKILLLCGAVLMGIGIVLQYAPDLLNWFGHLPGDIRIKNERSAFFFPITSMLLLSVVLSFIINVFFKR